MQEGEGRNVPVARQRGRQSLARRQTITDQAGRAGDRHVSAAYQAKRSVQVDM